jgi:hypothetical protein
MYQDLKCGQVLMEQGLIASSTTVIMHGYAEAAISSKFNYSTLEKLGIQKYIERK